MLTPNFGWFITGFTTYDQIFKNRCTPRCRQEIVPPNPGQSCPTVGPNLGVSIHGDSPKWMVYNGKS